MCVKTPKTRQEMLDVSGVGSNKLLKYGQRFMDEIAAFMKDDPDAVLSIKPEEALPRSEENGLSHAGQAWTDYEDQKLVKEFEAGMKIPDIAREHGRTRGGIRARLKRHGLIE